jgi:hypothetical protein
MNRTNGPNKLQTRTGNIIYVKRLRVYSSDEFFQKHDSIEFAREVLETDGEANWLLFCKEIRVT